MSAKWQEDQGPKASFGSGGLAGRRVLACSLDGALARLLAWNLAMRGVQVHQEAWTPCCGDPLNLPDGVELIVADLDCPQPGAWQGVQRLRDLYPSVPLVFLSYDWPTATDLQSWHPCAHLRKPIDFGNLLRAMRELLDGAP